MTTSLTEIGWLLSISRAHGAPPDGPWIVITITTSVLSQHLMWWKGDAWIVRQAEFDYFLHHLKIIPITECLWSHTTTLVENNCYLLIFPLENYSEFFFLFSCWKTCSSFLLPLDPACVICFWHLPHLLLQTIIWTVCGTHSDWGSSLPMLNNNLAKIWVSASGSKLT